VFRNILVCVDGSPESEQALTQAIDLADCQRSRLTILTAIRRPPSWANTPMTVSGIEPLAAELQQEARDALHRAVTRVPQCIPVTQILSEHPIREALATRLAQADYDLVVLGTRGRCALADSLHRGARRYALHHCEVPVLIVRAEGEAEPEPCEPAPEAPASAAPTRTSRVRRRLHAGHVGSI
jgi:nucleotide-binding universal stress UspA family protein